MTRLVPQPGIMEIALYKGGESRLPGRDDVLKLSSNENPYGPPSSAMSAFAAAQGQLHRYPPTDHAALRAAIGEIQGLDPDRIICGVGSDEVLQFLAQCYAGPGDEVIVTEHGFSLYPILALAAGATPVRVAERERRVDVDAILEAITGRTRLIFVTNPGNPTGTRIPDADLARLAATVPDNVLLVLDGAYAEFADGYDGGAALAGAQPNVAMTRTFSKLYGLGGLRIGWGYASREIIDVLNRVRQPFNLSLAQLAAAEAAMRDVAAAARYREDNAQRRDRLRQSLLRLGIACDESHANFVLARFAGPEEAEAADRALRGDGILVRRVAGYGFPEGLRITVGDEIACRRVAESLSKFRAKAA